MEGTKVRGTSTRVELARKNAARRTAYAAKMLEKGHPNVREVLTPLGLTLGWLVVREGDGPQGGVMFRREAKLAAIRLAGQDSMGRRNSV